MLFRSYFVGISDATSDIGKVGYHEAITMYSTPLTIYSGVNNPIKISCMNSDQKLINVSNVDIQCGLFYWID